MGFTEPDGEFLSQISKVKIQDSAIHRTRDLPEQLPTVRQVVHWIARLGGFLGRKNDKEPGITVIWRGWQRLNDIAATWLLFHSVPYG